MPQTFRDARCYRSMLYVPGNKLDWMLKAPKYGADALVFDLEDAVAIPEKPAAREAVATAITQLRTVPSGLFVRLNSWRTGMLLDDLSATVVDGLHGVMLSKTEDTEEVAALDLVLGELERSRGLPVGQIEICPLTETAAGMYRLFDICMASKRIKRAGAAVGPTPGGDGARSLGIDGATEEGIYFGAYSVLQARAAGIVHIEASMTGQLDVDAVRRINERSKRMGATWASIIHPSHVPVVNEIYSPSQSEIDEARAIVSFFAEAVSRGEAAVRYKSKLLDYASMRAWMNVLKKAKVAGIDVGDIPTIEVPDY
ncbi:citrate lyase subunit beta/citryl-CoA lyase [Bradyrhizobium sp. USDA 4518]